MQAHIVSIGDELIKGEINNSNATYISRELVKRGIYISSIVTLPDSYEIAFKSFKGILTERGIFIITGGLGATNDDITRKIISGVLGKPLCIDNSKVKLLKQVYEKKKRRFRSSDMMQASYPEGGILLENDMGLAYGFYLMDDEQYIFSLPGVPKEMKSMFYNQVLPLLKRQGLFKSKYKYEILTFSCIPEYTLDQKLEEIVSKYNNIEYGTRSRYGLIKVRIESTRVEIEPCILEIINKLNEYYICRDEQKLESIIGNLLLQHGLTLAVAESCTAGFLSKVITDVPGSSRYYLGGVVAYSNAIKKNILNVSVETLDTYGAVSGETALEMARGVKEKLQSDIALSITGIAGPEGGTEEKAVGTVFICFYRNGKSFKVEKNEFSGDREMVRLRSVNKSLFMLYQFLKEI
jgi:nicotinamide-nucleotide amidase